PNITTFTDSGLSANDIYNYRVYATNGTGSSAPLNLSAPSAPSNLKINPDVETSLILNWHAGNNVARYVIQRGTNGTTWINVGAVPGDTLTYIDANLESGASYNYKIVAKNGAGTSTATSSVSAMADPYGDRDEDGYPNIYETIHQTNPLEASSKPTPTYLVDASHFTTIQSAVDYANEHGHDYDIIEVAPGIYNENITIYGRKLLLRSRDGARETIINGNQNGRCVTIYSVDTVLD